MGDLTEHFSKAEFACHCGCGFDRISPELVDGLEELRAALGAPIRVLSGCRCAAHNHASGGEARSEHLLGNAADIAVTGFTARRIYAAAREIPEFHGFGVNDAAGFLHVDVRPQQPGHAQGAPGAPHIARWCYQRNLPAAWSDESLA